MHPVLTRLFDELDRSTRPLPLGELRRRLKSLRLDRSMFARAVRFGRSCYRRNLLHSGPAYQALVLCWRSGQRSPIHDHRGSACALRVIEGVATEIIFEISPSGSLYPTSTEHVDAGSVRASWDLDIHQMGNLQAAGHDLITFHIYSPPLLAMGTYFLGNSVLGEDDRAISALIRQRTRDKIAPRGLSVGQEVRWATAGPLLRRGAHSRRRQTRA